DRPNAPRVIQHAFVSATAFGRRISIRRHTLGCRAMYVVASESLRASMAVTSSRTPTRLAEAKNPQWLYTVRFNAPDLWGPDADPNVCVSVDAWEPYLEPAEQAP